MTLRTTMIIVFIGGLALGSLFASGQAAKVLSPPWLKGYARTIAGETIGYHSPYPDATTALISRATDGKMVIEWETAPVPRDFAEPSATFVWMSGLATGKGAHRFTLTIDGRDAFTFHTGKTAADKEWKEKAEDGATLAFKATLVDQFQELFGFMFLKVPRSKLTPGKPLRLRVVGENAGGPDWFMVFTYDLKPSVRANGEPALVRFEGRLCQPVRVEISHIAPPVEAVVSAEGGGRLTTRLETGYNAVYFPVPAVAERKRISVGVEIGGKQAGKETVEIRPVVRRTIYLLPHSHVDIGYSDLQVVVEKHHWKYFEQAIELARRTESYPPGARFKWNTEVLWPAETYLRQATPEKRAAFLEAVRKKQIGIQALLANELTGLCQPEELFRLTEFGRRLGREAGVPVVSAMITDIPSYTWSLVPALAQSGVKYLSSGPNYMPTLTDGGDRIGGALKAWGDKPFYWISPSGREKVLFWMAGRGYSWFHGLNMGNLGLEKRQPVFDYMRALEDAVYPYEMVQVRYTTGGDNGPPDPKLSDTVKTWNEQFESPKIVIATSQEMFEEFELRYGDKIPTVQGDFTPYWEDGAASSAREVALNRSSTNRLLQAETLWSMIDPAAFPAAAFTEAWRQALLWDEHTWGAADSVSDPDGPNAQTQWAYKQAFALEADTRSRALFDAALQKKQRTTAPPAPAAEGRAFDSPLARGNKPRAATAEVDPGANPGALAAASVVKGDLVVADVADVADVDIYNTNSWETMDVVLLPRALSVAGDRVLDEAGRVIPSQRLSTGELAVLAARVPAFGAKRFTVVAGQAGSTLANAGVRGARTESVDSLANEFLSLKLDPKTGAVASLKKAGEKDIDYVDASRGGLNVYLYVPGRDPQKVQGVESVKLSVREPGPLVASLLVESDAPGAKSLRREVRIYAGLDRVDFSDLLDKRLVRDKESVHIAFPFKVAGGIVRLDLGWAAIRPDADQIAGSCKDFFCVQNSADVSGPERGVTWVSLDAPLVEVGALTDETPGAKNLRAWKTEVGPSTALFSYVLNNYWHTNYKADQEGPVLLRYAVRLHGAYDAAAAVKFGMERARPLLAGASDPAAPAAKLPFDFEAADVLVSSLRPSEDGRGWIIRLYNPSPEPGEARLAAAGIYRSDPDEILGEKLAGPLRLAPFEILTLKIER